MVTNVTLVGARDSELERLVRAAGLRCVSLPAAELAALAHPAAPQPDVVLIDLRGERHLPVGLPMLKRQHPTTGVVIVASSLDPGLMLEAMRAGVNECLTEPISAEDLQAAIGRLAELRPAAPSGRLFAFVGAKGGVGATTVAVNVATTLARTAPKQTLLVDLHRAHGDAAIYLGVEPRFSILDALENTHRLDDAFFRGLVMHTKAGLDLLASSDRAAAGPVDPAGIRSILDFAGRLYRYTIVDVPRADTASLDGLESAAAVVVVANQELATVRNASRLAATLRQRYGKDKVRVVVSRSDRRAEISREDVERTVGTPVRHILPSDYRLALDAMNRGRPLVLENHNALSAALVAFARDLAGLESPKPPRTERSVSLFGRLAGRG